MQNTETSRNIVDPVQLRALAARPATRLGQCSPAALVLDDAIRHLRRQGLVRIRQAIDLDRHGRQDAMPPRKRGLSLILLKPVGDRCNLRCTYCYEGSGAERRPHEVMPDSILEAAIRDSLHQASGPITFAWHGGEPLLAGLDLFRRGIQFQRAHNVRRVPIQNTVQTNGLLLTEDWCRFFSDEKFAVGLSLDGPSHLHDRFRITAGNHGTYSQVVRAIELLQRNNLEFGVISVVTPWSIGFEREFFDLFRTLGIVNYDVHPNFGMPTQQGGPIGPAPFAHFMTGLFDAWIESGIPGIRIATFQDALRFLLGDTPSICYFAGACRDIMAFEADGAAVPCTRPFDRSKHTFGNIGLAPLSEILKGKALEHFVRDDLAGQAKADHCRWFGVCHNGCPQHRVSNGAQDIAGANLYCRCVSGLEGGYAAIFDHVEQRTLQTLRGIQDGSDRKA